MKAVFKAAMLMAIIMAFALPAQVHAQAPVKFATVAGDTITNAGTVNKTFQSTGATRGVVVQTNLTKISGTGAGTVGVYASLDGVKYTLVGSAQTITDVAAQTFMFYITNPIGRYYRVTYTGSGTESVATVTWYKITL